MDADEVKRFVTQRAAFSVTQLRDAILESRSLPGAVARAEESTACRSGVAQNSW